LGKCGKTEEKNREGEKTKDDKEIEVKKDKNAKWTQTKPKRLHEKVISGISRKGGKISPLQRRRGGMVFRNTYRPLHYLNLTTSSCTPCPI
jgi:hypothetical protein